MDVDAPRADVAHLMEFVHAVYWEDNGLSIWDDHKFADIAEEARTWHDRYMAELDEEDEEG